MLGRSRPARVARAAGLLAGLSLLLFSVVNGALTTRDRQITAQDGALRITLGQQLGATDSYFERARTIDALLASNPVFADFYRAPGTMREKIDAGGPLMTRVTDALGVLEKMFPGRIGEACFIDSSGSEIARVVDGVAATPSQLSADEVSNPFFAPTLALGAGTVYQAKVYESQDTHDPVVSNSTVVSAAGHTGMVHFEIAVSSFRMPRTASGISAAIVDGDTGHVVVDSGTATSAATERVLPGLLREGRSSGVVTLAGHRIAYEKVPASAGNANNWYVAVAMPAFGTGWTHGLGVGSLALILAALLIMTVAGVSGWAYLASMRRAAAYDALTGLPTRTLLGERLTHALRGDRRAAVLLVDLERFREVNEMLGYRPGDRLLQEVAARLAATLPAPATVARLGGDDFAVLLPDAGPDEARTAAQAVLAELHRSFSAGGISLDLEATVGAALAPGHGADADTLLRHADAALHLAKEDGSGYQAYEPRLDEHAPNRLALLGDLRRAVDADDQITVHYQPKMDLATGRVGGVEALVRWEHPERGRVMPDHFIPLAESTSLIRPLTDRVLRIAIGQAQEWRTRGLDIPVAVNLSTRCLLDDGLAARVFGLLGEAGLDPSRLELEITETMVMADPERATAVLHELSRGGIRLSIDDFGTGHSSMAYLRRLPVDELKIDRSFVQDMAAGPDGDVLVRTAVALGHNLGLAVVAEGVEDAATVAALAALGCDLAQGYHFARPMPAAELDAWLATVLVPEAHLA